MTRTGVRRLVVMLVSCLALGSSPGIAVADAPRPSAGAVAADLVGAGPPSSRVLVRGRASSERQVHLGVQWHALWSHQTQRSRARTLDRIQASGARWVRIDVSWAMIQPRRRSYDLGWGVPKVDTVIDEARSRGLKVLVTFWLTPSWANGGAGERHGPDDPDDYARALAWAVERWSGKVRAWEVWNEQNSDHFLRGADPKEYTRLLCAAHRRAKATGVRHRLLYGGVMYNDSDFIRATYRAGVRNCFDVMATHPYMAPSDAPPGLADDGTIWRLRHLGTVRRVQRAHRDRTPIWATEFGWSAHANDGSEQSWNRGVTERRQARYAKRALRIMRDDYPYVRKAFWYNDVMRRDGDPQLNGFGMLRPDMSPRPVWHAFRSFFS